MKKVQKKLVYIIGGSMVAGAIVFGTVTSVVGSRVMIADEGGRSRALHVVDASAAKITEGLGAGSEALSVDNLAPGDTVMVIPQSAA